jgi:hypothetical protein
MFIVGFNKILVLEKMLLVELFVSPECKLANGSFLIQQSLHWSSLQGPYNLFFQPDR